MSQRITIDKHLLSGLLTAILIIRSLHKYSRGHEHLVSCYGASKDCSYRKLLVLQLGVVATYTGDDLQALYHFLFSLAVHSPFLTARANAKMMIDKVVTYLSQH